MPLHVDIRVNNRLIETLHIGRMKGDMQADTINEYVATFDGTEYDPGWFTEGAVTFTHRYGDGAAVCVQKALNAMFPEGVDARGAFKE